MYVTWLAPFCLYILTIATQLEAKGSPPALIPTWIREKQALLLKQRSKLEAPPRAHHASGIVRRGPVPPPPPTVTSPAPPTSQHPKTHGGSTVKRSPAPPPPARLETPLKLSSPPPPPSGLSKRTLRSFERITIENGKQLRSPFKEQIIVRGKVVQSVLRAAREAAAGSAPTATAAAAAATAAASEKSLEKEKQQRRARRSADSAPSSPAAAASTRRFVSRDGTVVITTSSSDEDILVVMGDASPMTTSVFSNADRKIKKAYEAALDDVEQIFVQMGGDLAASLPEAAKAFDEAKRDLDKKMDGFKQEGAKTRSGAVRKAVELAATTDDATAGAMRAGLGEFLVYDSSAGMMEGLLYSSPIVYSLLQSATAPIEAGVVRMHGAVESYVVDALTGMRLQLPPLANTTMEIEQKMRVLLADLTEKTNKKISGMLSYETLDAINDLDGAETQSVAVIQTGDGFSYVTLSSAAPAFAKSLNGTEERAKAAVEEYRKQLEPYVNGQLLDPKIFGNVPAHAEKTKSVNELLDQLGREVDDLLHAKHPAAAVAAAKEIQSQPEEKRKLAETLDNSTVYGYVPVMYNGWYGLAPVAYSQASNLAVDTSNQLNSIKGQAVNYAYSLLMDIFGQYQLALVPIQEAVANMTETGGSIGEKVQQTLPFAIAQATTELPKEKKIALQQIVYYVPAYPYFG